VAVIGLVVLAVDRVDLRAMAVDERGGHVVLGREGIGGAQRDLAPTREQRPDEVRGLRGDMQAARHPHAVEWALALEPLPDLAQDRHLAVRPLDPLLAGLGERDVSDVVALLGGCQVSPFVA
jgi:hypothetical protein